jgi:hypothetical protein
MDIRRTAAALVAAAALTSGGALTACGGPQAHTGTPADTAANTTGASPGNPSQGQLPDNSNRETSSGAGRAGGNGKGVP